MLGIYVRLSKEDADSNSIEHQTRQGKEFAKSNQLKHKIYNEGQGLSGGLGIEDRPMLKSLLDDVKSNKISVIWVRDQSRLERNTELWFTIVKILRECEAELYTGDKYIDLDNDEELLPTNLMSLINDMQRKKQGRLTKRSISENFQQGKVHGVLPYGYSKDADRYLIVDDLEAAVVKEIFKLSADSLGVSKIANILNERNIPTRYSKTKGTRKESYKGKVKVIDRSTYKWSSTSVLTILKNPIYKGQRRAQVKKNIEYHKSPVIIDEVEWGKVNSNLEKNKTHTGRTMHNYLLKYVLKCGVCGRNYVGRTRANGKDHRYICSSRRIKEHTCNNRSIHIDRIEELVWDTLIIEMPNHVQEYLKVNSTDETLDKINSELLEQEQEQKRVKGEHRKLIQLARKGFIADSDIAAEVKSINTELESIKIKIFNLTERKQSISNDLLSVDNILEDVGVLKEFSFEEKRELIEKYIDFVSVVYRTDIKEFSDNGEYFVMMHFKNGELPWVLCIVDKNHKTRNYIPKWATSISAAMFHGYLEDLYDFSKT